jgi:hypothetical protein
LITGAFICCFSPPQFKINTPIYFSCIIKAGGCSGIAASPGIDDLIALL